MFYKVYPNGKRLVDAKLNLEDIAAWHVYCDERGYTYNKVIDYETNVDEILRDVCSAGAATPAIVDGKRTIVVDNAKEDIVQIFTPRNTWGYSGELIYPDLPHAFRVKFRNKDKGYQQDERIVYDDGLQCRKCNIIEVLDYPNCTNSELAFKHARRHLATARLRPEKHTFMCDVEHIVALRGDRIKLAHDVPIIGIGDGRIKTIVTDNGSPELVTGFTIDDTVTIPDASTYYVRIRLQNGEMLYKEVITSVGDTSTFTFAESFALDDSPGVELNMAIYAIL
jgi:predicted phage tail protein